MVARGLEATTVMRLHLVPSQDLGLGAGGRDQEWRNEAGCLDVLLRIKC